MVRQTGLVKPMSVFLSLSIPTMTLVRMMNMDKEAVDPRKKLRELKCSMGLPRHRLMLLSAAVLFHMSALICLVLTRCNPFL